MFASAGFNLSKFVELGAHGLGTDAEQVESEEIDVALESETDKLGDEQLEVAGAIL
jgi:hypothetical protein